MFFSQTEGCSGLVLVAETKHAIIQESHSDELVGTLLRVKSLGAGVLNNSEYPSACIESLCLLLPFSLRRSRR